MQLYLTAQFELNDPAFAPTFAEHARASRAKLGCLWFYLAQDKDNPRKFATMECWENYDYFEAHTKDEEHDAFLEKIKQVWVGPPEVFEGKLVMGME